MSPCPEKNRIVAYAHGKISPELVDSLSDHVDSCTDCQATLVAEAAADDTLVTQLRIAAHTPQAYDEPELHQAAALAQASRSDEITQQAAPGLEQTVAQPAASQAAGAPPAASRHQTRIHPPPAPKALPCRPPIEQFLKALETTGLMTADEFAAFQAVQLERPSRRPTCNRWPRRWCTHGKLTKFQAAHVVQGKAKGLVFGEYLVIDKIGAGGMGQVFKARHRRMKRIVAIKVLPPAAVKTPDAVQALPARGGSRRPAGASQHRHRLRRRRSARACTSW